MTTSRDKALPNEVQRARWEPPSARGSRLPLWLVAILVAAHGLRVLLLWDDLPPVMASHFGFSGRPDGWMSKSAFFAFDAALIALVVTIPLWIRVLPPQFINVPLPHRDYWFAPERRRQLLAWMAPWFNWLTFFATLFMLFVLEQVVRANLAGRAVLTMSGIGLATLALISAVVIWLIGFHRTFRNLPGPPGIHADQTSST